MTAGVGYELTPPTEGRLMAIVSRFLAALARPHLES